MESRLDLNNDVVVDNNVAMMDNGTNNESVFVEKSKSVKSCIRDNISKSRSSFIFKI